MFSASLLLAAALYQAQLAASACEPRALGLHFSNGETYTASTAAEVDLVKCSRNVGYATCKLTGGAPPLRMVLYSANNEGLEQGGGEVVAVHGTEEIEMSIHWQHPMVGSNVQLLRGSHQNYTNVQRASCLSAPRDARFRSVEVKKEGQYNFYLDVTLADDENEATKNALLEKLIIKAQVHHYHWSEPLATKTIVSRQRVGRAVLRFHLKLSEYYIGKPYHFVVAESFADHSPKSSLAEFTFELKEFPKPQNVRIIYIRGPPGKPGEVYLYWSKPTYPPVLVTQYAVRIDTNQGTLRYEYVAGVGDHFRYKLLVKDHKKFDVSIQAWCAWSRSGFVTLYVKLRDADMKPQPTVLDLTEDIPLPVEEVHLEVAPNGVFACWSTRKSPPRNMATGYAIYQPFFPGRVIKVPAGRVHYRVNILNLLDSHDTDNVCGRTIKCLVVVKAYNRNGESRGTETVYLKTSGPPGLPYELVLDTTYGDVVANVTYKCGKHVKSHLQCYQLRASMDANPASATYTRIKIKQPRLDFDGNIVFDLKPDQMKLGFHYWFMLVDLCLGEQLIVSIPYSHQPIKLRKAPGPGERAVFPFKSEDQWNYGEDAPVQFERYSAVPKPERPYRLKRQIVPVEIGPEIMHANWRDVGVRRDITNGDQASDGCVENCGAGKVKRNVLL